MRELLKRLDSNVIFYTPLLINEKDFSIQKNSYPVIKKLVGHLTWANMSMIV